jgi:putative two-component system protein, hydrogenase maturation factor HypX/HoxX
VDGAVWISTLKRHVGADATSLTLPATLALERDGHRLGVPERPVPVHTAARDRATNREIAYEEDADAGVGYLRFAFYNGAMSTEQCRRLLDTYEYARSRRETKVIVLMGGRDFFSNGIHLNVIEAADDPAAESWLNLHAIDDVVRDIVETDSHLVISALTGDAGAGGVPLALAADQVVAREDIVLNPYYGHMGGLYGSEYWTYLLPRRVGAATTERLVGPPFTPVGAREAVRIGLIDTAFGATAEVFEARTRTFAWHLAQRLV